MAHCTHRFPSGRAQLKPALASSRLTCAESTLARARAAARRRIDDDDEHFESAAAGTSAKRAAELLHKYGAADRRH